jgi:hypothetical protein
MGSVWLAERIDGLLNRQVALKLPHGAWPHAQLAERLQRERDILAGLEHPNIARLYDAGLTTDGQPYLALEYVEGKPIDEYCRIADRQLSIDVASRVRLFLQVARAVAYALTSLTPAQADAARLEHLWRGHWPIENGLHYVRAVTWGEDACQVRTGYAPANFAACRNTALRRHAMHPRAALALLGIRLA